MNFKRINSTTLEKLILDFDDSISNLKNVYGIELKTYGNILRLAFNILQNDAFDNLLDRIRINRELENALDNAGGYEVSILGNKNPKTVLVQILSLLRASLFKSAKLQEYVLSESKRTTIITDTNDIDFLSPRINKSKTKLLSYKELKKNPGTLGLLVFYSFNGERDFNLIYNTPGEITLILYEEEYKLFQKYLLKRKKTIEWEISSKDRLEIFSLPYEEVPVMPVRVSGTIEEIVNRLDNWGQSAYNGYREEADLLLDEIEEKIVYKIKTESSTIYVDSNETVYDSTGDLVKAYKLKINDRIKVYPRELLAENLFHVAVETEPELFGKIEQHSIYWKNAINTLSKKYDANLLYQKLKSKGLRVLPNTVDAYLKGARKFPMYNNDLRAIIELHSSETGIESESEELIKLILKSKSAYNSTMIALGKGLKQELKLFLKEQIIGEILNKRGFTASTLQKFVEDYMPTVTVMEREAINEQEELVNDFNAIQNLEI